MGTTIPVYLALWVRRRIAIAARHTDWGVNRSPLFAHCCWESPRIKNLGLKHRPVKAGKVRDARVKIRAQRSPLKSDHLKVKVMQFSPRERNGAYSRLTFFRKEKYDFFATEKKRKRFAWSTAQQCELPAPPGLLRQVRLKLWLRNYFPGQSVKPQLSATLLTVASRWVVQDQIAWRGGP